MRRQLEAPPQSSISQSVVNWCHFPMSVVCVEMKVRVINCTCSAGMVPLRELSAFTKWKTSKCWFPGNSLHICTPSFTFYLLCYYTHTHLPVKAYCVQKTLPVLKQSFFILKALQISPTCALLWSVISRGWGLKQLSLTQSEARFNTTFSPPLAHCAVLRTHTLTHRQRE